jgi:hypothetical protein
MTQTINGPFTQTIAGAVTVNAPGPWSYKLGPVNFKTDAHVAITFGATSDTFIGVKNSNTLAISLSSFAGVDVSLNAALKMSEGPTKVATWGAKKEVAAAWDVKTGASNFLAGVKASFAAAGALQLKGGVVQIG